MPSPSQNFTGLSESLAHIGCVSFLNSKPLIDPLVDRAGIHTHFAVPSALLELVESGTAATGLMSVVDYQASRVDLVLVPAGMIGCDGPTLTVRIYSRVPAREIETLHADTDSHTSVVLAQVILRERYGVSPAIVPLPAGAHGGAEMASLLLIGDKVINASPSEGEYPHQLDLGEEWHAITGLPFVFAMWMMRKDALAANRAAALDVARLLADARRRGADLTDHLLDRYAAQKHWPRDLARRYFTEYLRYEVTPRAREGLARFFEMAGRLGLIETPRKMEYLEFDAT